MTPTKVYISYISYFVHDRVETIHILQSIIFCHITFILYFILLLPSVNKRISKIGNMKSGKCADELHDR